MAFLILPETAGMRAAYFENRVWFFSLLIAVPVFGSLQQFLVEGHVHNDLDTAAKGLGILLTVGAIYFRSEPVQKAFAIVGIVFIDSYVWGFFFQLPSAA